MWCCLQVTLCDPYLSALEAFARRRAIQIHVYFTLSAECGGQLPTSEIEIHSSTRYPGEVPANELQIGINGLKSTLQHISLL